MAASSGYQVEVWDPEARSSYHVQVLVDDCLVGYPELAERLGVAEEHVLHYVRVPFTWRWRVQAWSPETLRPYWTGAVLDPGWVKEQEGRGVCGVSAVYDEIGRQLGVDPVFLLLYERAECDG